MSEMEWKKLHFGNMAREDIKTCISMPAWQEFRKALKGLPLKTRYDKLLEWLEWRGNSHCARVQVTNYVNALRRGGMVKLDLDEEPKEEEAEEV